MYAAPLLDMQRLLFLCWLCYEFIYLENFEATWRAKNNSGAVVLFGFLFLLLPFLIFIFWSRTVFWPEVNILAKQSGQILRTLHKYFATIVTLLKNQTCLISITKTFTNIPRNRYELVP